MRGKVVALLLGFLLSSGIDVAVLVATFAIGGVIGVILTLLLTNL